MPRDVGITVQLTQTGLHQFEGREQLLEFETTGAQFCPPFQWRGSTVEADLRIQLATRHAKAQGFQIELAIVENRVRIQVIERQLLAVHDALAGELDVGIHVTPTLGTKRLDRQYLVCWLLAVTAACLLLGIGVGADQRRKVREQQLIGDQRTTEFGSWLAGHVNQVAMNVAAADGAIEVLIAERRTLARTQVGDQVTVCGIG
ncbi:hypothetical protein D3C85_1113030 [compost metagenome]